MYVLAIKQPWASQIISGQKTVENRSWEPPPKLIGQRLAIHAGLGRAGKVDATMPRGAIIGTVVVEGVYEKLPKEYRTGRDKFWHIRGDYGWILRAPRRLGAPIPAKGKLRLWTYESPKKASNKAAATPARSKRARTAVT